MNLTISRTDRFTKSFKKLAKRYNKIAKDYSDLLNLLESDKHNAVSLGYDLYKICLSNSSNPKGKSSGFRVVYFLKNKDNEIFLLDIFSKNEIENISKNRLFELIGKYGLDDGK